MRIKFYNIKDYLWLLFGSIVVFIFGIILIMKAPSEGIYVNSIFFSQATQYESLMITDFYPVGILGSETEDGKEYSYYVVSMKDYSRTDFLVVVRSNNKEIVKLLESNTPTAFGDILYGSAEELSGEAKSAFDEMVENENLNSNYLCADWYFDDSSRNLESESAICIICGFTMIICAFVIAYIFFRKITKPYASQV